MRYLQCRLSAEPGTSRHRSAGRPDERLADERAEKYTINHNQNIRFRQVVGRRSYAYQVRGLCYHDNSLLV